MHESIAHKAEVWPGDLSSRRISAQINSAKRNHRTGSQRMQRIIEGMKSGGGYIFAPGHPVLQDDVPVENIITMYRSGFEYVNTKGIPTIYC